MNEKQLRDLLRWVRDCEFEVDIEGRAVLTREATLRLYDYKYEVVNFIACQLQDKPLVVALEEKWDIGR